MGRDVKVAGSTSSSPQTNLFLLSVEVFLYIGFCTLEDDLALLDRRLGEG